jgi:hypothetical protein
MKPPRVLFAILSLLVLLAMGTAAGATPQPVVAAMADPQPARGTLVFTKHTTSETSGTYAYAGSLLTFTVIGRRSSGSSPMGAETIAVVVEATVTVNDKVLKSKKEDIDAAFNGQSNALMDADRSTLEAASNDLHERFDGKTTTAQDDWLIRSTDYWAEAPLGYTLSLITATKPATEGESVGSLTQPPGAPTSCPAPEGQATSASSTSAAAGPAGADTVAACQVADGDGITYVRPCAKHWHWTSHDATTHCFFSYPTPAGQARDIKCRGRCGPGCPLLTTWGVYTQDCLDHDECCRVHGGCFNPWAASCGDEYREAANDFAFGWRMCL